LLELARAQRSTPGKRLEAETLIAASIGWMSHRAADLQMKPLSKRLQKELKASNPLGLDHDEFQIYQDAVAFREVYDGGRVQPGGGLEPVSPATLDEDMGSHPASAFVDAAALEPLFAGLLSGELIAQQAFMRQPSPALSTFFDRRQVHSEPLSVYIEAFSNPNAQKMVSYIDAHHWYDSGDGIIRWARALQRGGRRPRIGLDAAIEAARTQSQYAQALFRGMQSLKAAMAFFRGDIDKHALLDALEIKNAAFRAHSLMKGDAREVAAP
jgi:hypothetical protein